MEMIFTFFTYVGIGLLVIFTPFILRKTIVFGVTLPEEMYKDKQIKAVRKKYLIGTTIAFISLAIPFFIYKTENSIATYFNFAIIGLLFAQMVFYLLANRQVKKIKMVAIPNKMVNQKIIVDTNFREESLKVSNWWFSIPFLLIVGTAFLSYINYDHLPDQLVTHYNLTGAADGWTDKSLRSLFLLPLIQLAMLALFVYINSVIHKVKQTINPRRPTTSVMQNKKFRRAWSIFLVILAILTTLLFSIIQLDMIYNIGSTIIMLFTLSYTLITLVLTIVLIVKYGQGGERINIPIEEEEKSEANSHDDDQYWKLGVLYFNPSDPAVWVEKRFGIGWTVNFGRWQAWAFFVIVIGASLLPLLF